MSFKKPIIILFVVAGFVGGTGIGIGNTVDWDSYVPVVKQELRSKAGLDLKLEGELRPEYFPYPRLQAQFVKIDGAFKRGGSQQADAPETTTLLEVDVAYISFNPIDWVRGRPYIQVTLISPEVLLERNPDGDYSVERFLRIVNRRALTSTQSRARGQFLSHLRSVTAINGRYELASHAARGEETVRRSAIVSDGKMTYMFDDGTLSAQSADTRHTVDQFEYEFELKVKDVKINSYALDGTISRTTQGSRNASVSFKGDVRLKPNPSLELETEALVYLPL